MEINPHKYQTHTFHNLRKQQPLYRDVLTNVDDPSSLYRRALNVVVQNPSLNTNILPTHIRKHVQREARYQENVRESKKYWKK